MAELLLWLDEVFKLSIFNDEDRIEFIFRINQNRAWYGYSVNSSMCG